MRRLPTTAGHAVVVQNQFDVSTKTAPLLRAALTSPEMRSERTAASRGVAHAVASLRLADRHEGGSSLLTGLSPRTTTLRVTAVSALTASSAPAAQVTSSAVYWVYELVAITKSGLCSVIQAIALSRHAGQVNLSTGVGTVTLATGQPALVSTTSSKPCWAAMASTASNHCAACESPNRTISFPVPLTPYEHGCKLALTPTFTQPSSYSLERT